MNLKIIKHFENWMLASLHVNSCLFIFPGCLKSHGVCEVFCFCTRGELQKYRTQWLLSELTEADISVHHCAFPDGAAPPIGTLMTLLEEIRVMLMQGKRTYIQ